MTPETIITFNINAGVLLIGLSIFFLSLFGLVWKGKREIVDTMNEQLSPMKQDFLNMKQDFVNMAIALAEIKTILQMQSNLKNLEK